MGTPEFIRTATLTLWDNGADTMAIATALGIKEHIAAYIIHCEQDVACGACSYGPLAGI